MKKEQKIRYVMRYEDNRMRAIYPIESLEDRSLIKMMNNINSNNISIIRRDLSTGMTDESGSEVFENDKIITEKEVSGYVRWKPGGFYLNGSPLGNYEIKEVIKEV